MLDILTFLGGHTPGDPDEEFHEYFDYIIDSYIRYKLTDYTNKDQLEIDFDRKGGYGKKKELWYPNKQDLKIFKSFDKFLDSKGMDESEYIKEHQDDVKETLFTFLIERFYEYYSVDKNGTDILSDYGLEPLIKLLFKLLNEENPDKKLPILDRMLNVMHMRSDLAAWLVDGDTRALDDLSGYGEIGTEGGLTKDDLIKMRDNIK